MRRWIDRLPIMNRALIMTVAMAMLGGAGLFTAVLTGFPPTAAGEPVEAGPGNYGLERTDGKYYTISDEQGKPLDYTAHILYPGDEFITADNQRYRITVIEGDIARAKLVGQEADAALEQAPPVAAGGAQQVADGQQEVAVYHTHSDESYVPSDGTDSIYGAGGILKVGTALSAKLQSLGYKVTHSVRPHDPHDSNAYMRSRRTAVELVKAMPAALFDVHRDATPPEVYSATVKGKPVTKVKFVIGTENPHSSANLQFAKELKAAEDEVNPGLIQGILLTRGDFNQDLSPRSLLIEVGSHTNNRNAAENGAAFFAEAVPKVLGGTATGQPSVEFPATGANRSAWTSVFWIVLVAAGVLAAYLYINTGSWQGAWEQIRRFVSEEFGSRIRNRR
jgi:stage II sporulation protein P